MLSPDYLLHISEGAEEIASQLHTDMLRQIIKRIMVRQRRGYDYILTASDKWRVQSLMEAGYLRDDLVKEIARATKREQDEIRDAFEDAGAEALEQDDKLYERAGISTTPLDESPYMVRLMQRNYDATMGEWSNFTRTTAGEAEQKFIDTMDRIYNNVMSGGIGYIEAYVDGINHLANDGLIVRYPSGHTDTIETATLRCVRTGVAQASAQVQIARMDEYDIDLVLVSSHMGARPSHAVWQGKVYSRRGQSSKYPDFVTSTGYGTGAGLCGWNCRHHFSPYFEGMGNPYEHYDSKENREVYEKTQRQRSMERAIRKTKRKAEVLREAINTTDDENLKEQLQNQLTPVQSLLGRQNKAYKEYCDTNDLRPLPERLKIAKADRAQRKNLLKKDVQQRARTIKTDADLFAVSNSSIIDMKSIEEIKAYFKDVHGIDVNGFEKKDLLAVKSPLAGYDDMLNEFPELHGNIKAINFNSRIKANGDIDLNTGVSHVGHSGLLDYGTGVHESAHMLDHLRSMANVSYSEKIISQAKKNLRLRKNSREYKDLCIRIVGVVDDLRVYNDQAELFAYAIETHKGNVKNSLASEIYRLVKGV